MAHFSRGDFGTVVLFCSFRFVRTFLFAPFSSLFECVFERLAFKMCAFQNRLTKHQKSQNIRSGQKSARIVSGPFSFHSEYSEHNGPGSL